MSDFQTLTAPATRWRRIAPTTMIARLWRHRDVATQLAIRTVRSGHGGTALGLFWVVFKPLLMLAVYTFVFGVVFKSRFYSTGGAFSPIDFGLALFAGLSIFTVLSEMLAKAPSLIKANANFVKRVVFPLDVLVLSEFGATVFTFLITMAIFVVALALRSGGLPPSSLSAPFIIAPFLLFVLGLSWFLASLGVYLPDINQLVGVVISVLMFVSPIFFPVSALPAPLQEWMFLNPVASVVEQTRAAFFLGHWPDPILLGRQYLTGLLTLWLGWAWFELTRKGFADVI
ncbi:ABC transporter permease [Phenylobacterium sp. LjRoot225]|uniref:ABC transporter permease n=1 Tax=Phenylobacterium sp. LjRoot225 TaxID=3342285 RepID=UPI003ECF7B04